MANVKKINGYDVYDDTARTNIGCTSDTYNSNSTYAIGDVVIYDNKLHKCTTAITKAEEWTAAHWEQICLRDLLIETRDDLYYKAGDTELISFWYGGGCISSSSTGIYFTIPLQKRLKNVVPKITGGTLNVRKSDGGYILNTSSITDEAITLYESESNLLTIRLMHDTAFDAINNTPVGMDVRNLGISFTKKTA